MASAGGSEGSRQHNHDCSEHDCAAGWSLYKSIDVPHVRALNEEVDGSAQGIFRPWDKRLDTDPVLESQDDDPELLIFIPFTSDVKIRSICVVGGGGGTSPARMRAFMNREDLDFSTANDLAAVQEWELVENLDGQIEYPTKAAKFQGVANLTLHFPTNLAGDGWTQISFIGFKGEATQNNRSKVASVVYEAMPNPKDHQVRDEAGVPQIL